MNKTDMDNRAHDRIGGVELARLLDLPQVAELLGVGERHIRRLVFERRIPYLKWGHLLRFHPDDLAAWLDDLRRHAS